MMCLLCRDVYDGRDWEELIQSGDEFIQDGEMFVCPLCMSSLEGMTTAGRFEKYGISI